jgi:hypothetical protein
MSSKSVRRMVFPIVADDACDPGDTEQSLAAREEVCYER